MRSGRFSSRDELLEPARRFLGLIGQLALLLAGSAARRLLAERGAAPLPLGFLLLPARELLQLLDQLVDLLIGLLLRCLLARLVLVRHLVELQLEQVGEILRHLALPPPPPPPPCWRCICTCVSYSSSAFWRNCSAFCSGASAPSGLTACSLASAFFISATACGSSSATFLNAGSCWTSRLFIRVSSPST